MKNSITLLFAVIILASCARSVSIHQAAGSSYKSARNVR